MHLAKGATWVDEVCTAPPKIDISAPRAARTAALAPHHQRCPRDYDPLKAGMTLISPE